MPRMTDPGEPLTPFPPRFYWLKRIVVIAVLFVIGFAGLMRWWQYAAMRRLNDEIARLHEAGERVTVEDFAVAAVRDRDNAALSLQTAAKSLTLTKSEDRLVDYFQRDAAVDPPT